MTLFDGEDLRVVPAPASDPSLLIVSFTGRDHAPPAAVGAGAGFLAKNALSSVHVISKKNHWWNTEEWADALDAIKAYAEQTGAKEIVTYGSSMGGYGALVSSKRLGAARVVAYAPQYSINPEEAPWEKRWLSDSRAIRFIAPPFAETVAADAIYIFSDPYFTPDQQHVEQIRQRHPVQHLRVVFSEHDVSRVLSDCGMLSSITLQALRGTLTVPAFVQRYRADRRRTALVYGGASRLLRQRGKAESALAYGRRGFAMLTKDDSQRANAERDRMMLGFVELLNENGKAEEALRAVDRWSLAGFSSRFAFARLRAVALSMLDRRSEALEAIEAAMTERPAERPTHEAAADILKRLGAREEALVFFKRHEDYLMKFPTSALAFGRVFDTFGEGALSSDIMKRGHERFPTHAKLRRAVEKLR